MVSKGYIGFAEGMLIGRSIPKYKGGSREVDWIKAKDFIEKHKDEIASVEAGLAEDWGHTSDEVWNSENGYIPREECCTFACSTWATPSVEVTFKDGKKEMIECWKLGHNSDSYFES